MLPSEVRNEAVDFDSVVKSVNFTPFTFPLPSLLITVDNNSSPNEEEPPPTAAEG